MSSQYEEWFFVKDGKVYYHYENDGYQAMRRGLQATDTLLGPVEGIKIVLNKPGSVRKAIEEHDEKEQYIQLYYWHTYRGPRITAL